MTAWLPSLPAHTHALTYLYCSSHMGRCRVSGKEIRHTEGTYAGRRLCFGLPFGLERCQVREFKQPCKLGVTETVCYKAWWLSREGGTVADTAMHLCAWSALHQPLLENLPRRRLGKPRQTLLPPPATPPPYTGKRLQQAGKLTCE